MPIDEFIKVLVKLGMSEREAKIYLALVNKRGSSAAELQKLSGLRQNIVYETIGNLVRQGYCSEKKIGRRRIFEVVEPQFTLDFTIKRMEEDLETARKLKYELQAIYAEADEVKEPFEYIEIIHGNENIHRKYVGLLRTSQKELIGFVCPPSACYTDEMRAEQRDEFYTFRERGGKSRWICELNENSQPWELEAVEESSKNRENFRVADKLPIKMNVFDGHTLLISDEHFIREGELTMSIIKQGTTVKGYLALFEFFWNQSLEFEEWKKQHMHLLEYKKK